MLRNGLILLFIIFPITASALTFKSGESISSSNLADDAQFEVGPSFLIPNDVWLAYSNAPKELKTDVCGQVGPNQTAVNLLPIFIPERVKGLNSRMDNFRSVEGFVELDELVMKMSEFVTIAHANDAEKQLSTALTSLEIIANENGWVDTKSCTKNGYLSECEPAWQQKDGQDLAESMDWGSTQMRIMHLYYMYKALLSNSYTKDHNRTLIDDWFAVFIERNKRVNEVYFGMDLGWHWPELAKLFDVDRTAAQRLAKRMIEQLDKLVLEDGSLKDRTTRGNRALWYHYEAIGETLISLEIARALKVDVPTSLDVRLMKSVQIFIDGFENPSTLNKWASKAHNSIYKADEQKFNNTLDSLRWANSWFYIFQYRYPNHPASKRLEALLGSAKRSLLSDGMVGVGLGCIYEVARKTPQN